MKRYITLLFLLVLFAGCTEERQLQKIAGKIIMDSLEDADQYKFVSYSKTSELTLAETLNNKIAYLNLKLDYQQTNRRANLTLDSLSAEMIKVLEEKKEFRLADKEKLKRMEYTSLVKDMEPHILADSIAISELKRLEEKLDNQLEQIVLMNYEYILQKEDRLSTFFVQIDPIAGLVVNISEEERFLYKWYDPNIPEQ